MRRVYSIIKVNGKDCWTLFDSGARNTYVLPDVAQHLLCKPLDSPRPTAIGGGIHKIKEIAILTGKVEGHSIEVDTYVLDEIGHDEHGRKIEILLGALAMQKWGIELKMKEEKLDLTHYPKEFIEV